MFKLFIVCITKSCKGMDDKTTEIKSFYHKTKKILNSQRLHGFFGGPKGLPMHCCSLRTAHILINYDIKTHNISISWQCYDIMKYGNISIYKI